MKRLILFLLLIPLQLSALNPRYMDKCYRFKSIPLNSRDLFEMWRQRNRIQEDTFNLSSKDVITQLQFKRRDVMEESEIGNLIQFRNIDDHMRIGPMSINSSPWFEIVIVGTFIYRELEYLIYNIDYSFNGNVLILACLSANTDYPPSLIIQGGRDDSQYSTFEIDTLKNEISISRVFCTELVLKKVSRYSLDNNFELINESIWINQKSDSIWEGLVRGDSVNVEEMEDWVIFDKI